MNATRALPRLLWQPGLLLLLPLPFVAVAVPLIVAAEGGASALAVWRGDSSDAARTAIWHMTVLIPAVFGLAVAMARLELQHSTFSWMLPGLERNLLAGTAFIAVPLAAILGVLVARAAPAPAVSQWHGGVAFAVAVFWFTALSTALDNAFPPAVRWVAFLGFAMAAVRPGSLRQVAEQWPATTAAVVLGCVALALVVQFSKRASRLRVSRWSAHAPDSRTGSYWSARTSRLRWSHNLATERLHSWLRAAAYESSAGRGHVLRFPGLHLVAAAAFVFLAQLMNDPGLVLIMVGISLSTGRLQLGSTLPYPLSRARRADLAVTGAVIEAGTFAVGMAVMVFALRVQELPALAWFNDEPTLSWLAAIGMAFAWAPVAQLPTIRSPAGLRLRRDSVVLHLLPFLAYVVAARASAAVVSDWTPLGGVAAVLGITVITHLAGWTMVRRYYASADIVNGSGIRQA